MTKTLWTTLAVAGALATTAVVAAAFVDFAPSRPSLRDAERESYRRPTSVPFPATNPYSAPKAALGEALFFDTRTSSSRQHSCASCHSPQKSWGDGLPVAQGEGSTAMKVRSPTLYDIAWLSRLGWDGKFKDIEAVTFGPILSPSNVDMTEDRLLQRLRETPSYVAMFADAFPDKQINRRNIEAAVATYERTIVSGNAPFDRWIDGDEGAIDESAKRGFALFNGKANCSQCHSGWAFTDGSFHDIGLAKDGEIGRGRLFPTSVKLQHATKTPTLRDIARRGPYMHDGSVESLAEVIDLYDKGGADRPSRSDLIKPLGLSEVEKRDLVAFLTTLNDDPTHEARPISFVNTAP